MASSTYAYPTNPPRAGSGYLLDSQGLPTGVGGVQPFQQAQALNAMNNAQQAAINSNYGQMPAGQPTAKDQFDRNTSATSQNRQNSFELQRMNEQARLQAEAEARRQAAMTQMMDRMNNSMRSWGTGGTMPQVQQFQTGQMPPIAQIQAPDLSQAGNAAFARAKDRQGLIAQSALTGLRSSLGGRGLLGSGAELRGTQNVANAGQAALGEVNREQAIQGAQAAQQNALANYQGAIQQRGQDIGMYESQNRLAMQAAQMQFDQQMAMQQAQMQQQQMMLQALMSAARY